MKLTILGSNSAGNGYVLQNESEALILECGMRFQDAQKALDFNTQKVVGALISHEHQDHCKYVTDYQKKGIAIYASAGTNEKLKSIFPAFNVYQKNMLQHGKKVQIGNFTIIPFNLKHDCQEPIGFYIHHPETGNIIFATDTYYLPMTFADVSHWMIECNYRKDILDRNCPEGNIFKKILRDRTLESHMSFQVCKDALKANDLSQTENIILIHLSDGNSHAAEFKRDIEMETGKLTHIATKGMEINLSKYKF